MIKFRMLKNSYAKFKENFTHKITQEEVEERYLTKILDEAIEEFERNGRRTTSYEDWIKEIKEEFNIAL